jgi:hypothetical protein
MRVKRLSAGELNDVAFLQATHPIEISVAPPQLSRRTGLEDPTLLQHHDAIEFCHR